MENGSAAVATVAFVVVVLVIMTEKLNLTVAALFGALVLVFAHIMTLSEAMEYLGNSYSTLALVGDPATFIVGDAINIGFLDYLW